MSRPVECEVAGEKRGREERWGEEEVFMRFRRLCQGVGAVWVSGLGIAGLGLGPCK